MSGNQKGWGARASAWAVVVLPGLLLLVVFWPVVLLGHQLALRDVAHFYYPWYSLIRHFWHQGWLPVWNPYERLGVPLLAQGTAAVFYPGAWILLLPGPFGVWFRVYVLGHVLLAYGLMFRLLRRWQLRLEAATLGALCYAFSGQVLFMYTNPPFLVSAAWLPLTVEGLWDLLVRKKSSALLPVAWALAMTILGGDPQMVYHLALMALLLVVLQGRGSRTKPPFRTPSPSAWWHSSLARLLWVMLLAGGLAAVQVLPTAELVQLSKRYRTTVPRSLWELLAGGPHCWGSAQAWLGLVDRTAFPRTDHRHHVYQFSVSPVRLGELLWPGWAGHLSPQNTRWLWAAGWEDRPWTLSLYLGLAPLMAAGCCWSLRCRSVKRRWLSWMVLLSTLASWGGYGLVWGLRSLGVFPQKWHWVGDEVGGVYWLLVVLLPRYVLFRYPAKWFTLATLALAALAGYGTEALIRTRRGLRTFAAWGLVVLGLTAGAVGFLLPATLTLSGNLKAERVFGLLDVARVPWTVTGAFAHTLVVLGVLWFCFRGLPRRWWSWALVVVVAVDLAAAQRPLVATVPEQLMTAPSSLAQRLAQWQDPQAPLIQPGREPLRIDHPGFFIFLPEPEGYPAPELLEETGPKHLQLAQHIHHQRQFLLPKWNLLDQVAVLEAFQTLELADWALLKALSIDQQIVHCTSVEGRPALVRHLQPRASVAPNQDTLPWFLPGVKIDQLPIKHRPKKQLPSCLPSPAELTSTPAALPLGDQVFYPCRCTAFWPGGMQYELQVDHAGVLVLPWQFYPGWRAVLTDLRSGQSQPVRLHRVNGAMLAVELPAGKWRLRLVYRPWSLWWGMVLTAFTVLLGTVLWLLRRRSRSGQ